MTIYTDGTNYFQLDNFITGNDTERSVRRIGQGVNDSVTMSLSNIDALIASGWTVAPDLSDATCGVWVNGLLVDPS